MTSFLLYLVIGLFVAILFFNVYFRMKILKTYRRLVQHQVQFNSSHVFSKAKMEAEILPKYPEHKEDIVRFTSQIKMSMQIASILIVLIILAGMIIKKT